jgi:Protein of unknown function (DUF1645)
MELENPSNGDEIDSSCSTPYVSAPSSPGRPSNAASSAPFTGGYFFSAPASPMHFIISNSVSGSSAATSSGSLSGDIEFEFSSRYLSSMISADEIFSNGQIRPISNLDTPPLSPIPDDEQESSVRGRDIKLRSGSIHRRARSMSPMRNNRYQWHTDEEEDRDNDQGEIKPRPNVLDLEEDQKEMADATIPSVSASSSRSSSSSSRSSKRWIFLKDLLYRSKSEGRERERGPIRERFWTHMPFSKEREKEKEKDTEKDKEKSKPDKGNEAPSNTNTPVTRNNAGTTSSRKRQSAHERLYNINRAHSEEMRRRTFLPYRQGLLGCLGFSSKSYGAFNGFTKSLNPVFSR